MKFVVKSTSTRGKPCPQAIETMVKETRTVLRKGGRERSVMEVEVPMWTIDLKFVTELVELVRENSSIMLSAGGENDLPEIIFTGA